MPIAKITGQGLSAIALAVAVLWACILVEHRMVRQAGAARDDTLHELRLLRSRTAPTAKRRT